jgi:thymidylate synthase (FAD)
MDRVELLDHGYIGLVETWGSDESIICAARMSTNKGFLGWGPTCDVLNCSELVSMKDIYGGFHCERHGTVGAKPGDEKLLRFLWENKHSTPFEMAGLTIEVKAPIMVFREWHRHRVPFGYNELSARYVPLPDENYSPTVERIIEGARGAGKNKQAQGSVEFVPNERDCEAWLAELQKSYKLAEETYQMGLELGVPKELARLPVPVARYSRMRATGNFRGWLAFMSLRAAPAAQWEIRQYANALGTVIAEHFPRTWELFAEGTR